LPKLALVGRRAIAVDRDDLRHPVRVSLVLYGVHRKAMWSLRSEAGMASASRVLRRLIRDVTPTTLDSMRRHFTAPTSRGALGRFARPSLLVDAADLERLDRIAEEAGAPSRSAVTRFLIMHAASQVPWSKQMEGIS
jgi:hypothetical protein